MPAPLATLARLVPAVILLGLSLPAVAQPIVVSNRPAQSLYVEEDDSDRGLMCSPSLRPFLDGVTPLEPEGAGCRYTHVRHLEIGGHVWTLALSRLGSEHEENAFLDEHIVMVDDEGRAFATIEQLDLVMQELDTMLRTRRFRVVSVPDALGQSQPGLCIETIEEHGPGTFEVWALERRGRPWRPRIRHRSADAWMVENTPRGPILRRRAAYDGLCPGAGYARFVEGPLHELGIVERRRLLGEATLPDARPVVRAPYTSPWPRGQLISMHHVRRAFPGHARYWWDDMGFENSPDTRVPIACAGRGRGVGPECLVRISLMSREDVGRMGLVLVAERERFAGQIYVRDPRFVGPEGIRVGARYRDLEHALEGCEARYADFTGMICRARAEPTITVELAGDGFAQCDGSEVPCDAALDSATVVALEILAP